MAKFSFSIPDKLTAQLNKLGCIDEVAPKMINSGLPIVEKELVGRSEKHRETGAMAASVKPTEPKKNKYGYYGLVRPTGRDEKGVRNMAKMAYLEYGTSKQSATPVLSPAVAATENQVVNAMQNTFDKEMKL